MSDLQRSLNASSVAETLSTYNKWAEAYNADVDKEGYIAPQLAAEYLTKYLPSSSDISSIKILDAGCGTGLVGQWLAERGSRNIDGIDLSPAMLDIARQTGAYQNLNLADLSQRIEIQSDEYDALVCVGTLTQGHVGPEALDEILRVVKPGGLIVATVRDSVWRKNGYETKVLGFIEGGKAKLVTEDFEMRRIATDCDLYYVVLEVL